MTNCSAPDCKNKGTHRFPKDVILRKKWEAATRKKRFKATPSSRLCTLHFKPDDFITICKYTGEESTKKRLKKEAVPSIFSFTKMKAINSKSIERETRQEMRNAQKELFCEEELHAKPSIKTQEIYEMPIEEPLPLVLVGATIAPNSKPDSSDQSTQVDKEHTFGSINRYKSNDVAIQFYTGFESYSKFFFVYSTLSPMAHKIRYYGSNVINISTENQFFLTVMKLKQNKCNYELSLFFNISVATVSNIFITWVNFIYQLWSLIEIWPDRELVQYYMPEHFKKYNKNIRIILGTTEIPVQKPQNPMAHQATLSSSKQANTLKILVGATPGGLLSFCSDAYAGSISDKQIVQSSGLINSCESGDHIYVLGDHGLDIQDVFEDRNVTVVTQNQLKRKSHLPGHVERLIGLTKTYKILNYDLNHSYIPLASKIFFICFMCCNFKEIKRKK